MGGTTKTYVATVVLQLVGEKRGVLDSPIQRYLPGLLDNGKPITVRQLLNHTSGVPDYTQDPSADALAVPVSTATKLALTLSPPEG